MSNLIARIIEPRHSLPAERRIFTNAWLSALIMPLFVERLLQMVVGLVDTMMVSHAGEAAVSGVSLDNPIINIFIFMFAALGTGGSVVVSQYIGHREQRSAEISAAQIFFSAFVFSVFCTALVVPAAGSILRFLFPTVDPDVYAACRTYLRIVALSFPATAVYNAGTAMFRSMGKTKTTMKVSMVMNAVNVVGNAIGIFVLKAGAAGVAWPTVIAWYTAAVIMTVLCFDARNPVRLRMADLLRPSADKMRRILYIAIPNCIENGLFQAAKVFLGTIVATFGTAQIAANGIGQTFWSLSFTVNGALQPAFITVIGQCMGAADTEAADYYMKKMMRIATLFSALWNFLIIALLPLVLPLYAISPETHRLVVIVVVLHNVFSAFLGPHFGPFGAGLRAAGDVKFAMLSAIFSTVICRTFFSWLIGMHFGLGVIGVTIAMILDWFIRMFLQLARYKSGAWKSIHVI